MSALNTNTLSIDYTLEENTGATRTAQIYTEVDGEIVDVMNITQAASAAYENPSGGSDLPDIEIDMSGETQAAIDAIKAKIANYRSLLNTSAYTTVKNKAIETIDYYKSQFDNSNTDSYNCVQIVDEFPLEIINSYYFELNYLLENYEKVQNFLAEITGNISDLKINSINRTLDNLEDDYNNLKDITEETSKITQSLIDSLSNDNLISPDEQLTLKLKLDEIVTEYVSISNSVNALIEAYTEASKPKVDENGEEHKEAFIAEDVAEYLEKLNTTFNDYKKNYNKACNILMYYTAADTNRDEFGNIAIVPDYDLESLPEFYEVRQTLLDVYYEANSYYTTYNRFGSKTTWIGDNGIYSGTIMADNLQGWCIQGLTVQSGINEVLPKDLEWYKYNGKEATSEADAFTKITADYRDENGNPVVNGPTWQIYKDGTGHLAKGGIRWNNDEVIFGDNTKISITREDGSTEIVPLGKNFSDMDDKIDEYLSEWQNDNIISYSEQRSMASVATEITAEHKQITGSVSNLITNLKDAQNKIEDATTDAVIDTYINSLDASDYLDATNKALAVIAYYTQEDTDGTFRSVTGSVEISADHPLSAISDYYDVRESLVESYNKAADFYTNNVNSIVAGVMQDVKVNAETIKGYIETWASDKVVSPAELAEFRVLYNTISSEKSDILLKVSKLDAQYEEYIASINEANIILKTTMQDYKNGLNTDAYVAESDDVLATLNYYLKYKASEDDINTYGEGFIPINTEYPLEDIYEYYDVKDALVEKYNLAFTAYTTYTNSELVERINDISTTNENIDKFIADWSDNNNVDPAEQVQMTYIKKEIVAEESVIKAAAALTLENVLDVEEIIINNGIEDDILLNTTSKYKNSLDITVATSDIANYDTKKNLALDVISYYTSSNDGSFVDIVTEKPLSAIDDYYAAREKVKDIVNEANSFCTGYNSGNFKDILNKLSDTNEKITDYINSWLDDNGIDPAEQTEMEYIGKEIVAETLTLVTAAVLSISNLAAVEKKIADSEMPEDDELLTNIENIKKRLDSTAFADASNAAQRVINYYVNSKKDSNGFIAFNENYPLDDIDNYYTERENLTQSINEADSLCQTYNDIAINNVIGGLSDTNTKITEYIATWKDDKLISPAERSELGRILSEILVEEAGVIASVKDINDKLADILTTDGDKIGSDVKYEINEIIDTLDTTAFKTAADNAETVLQYYTTTANIEDNGFIKIIEDQKLEVVEIYYKEREAVKNNYNVALSFYNAYNKSSINILNKDLEDYAKKMDEFIDAVSADGYLDANERRQFQIYRAEIASDSRSLDAAASSLRTDLNALAATTGNIYIIEISKHLDAIGIGILGYANSAIDTLDYYINATPDKNNLIKIDSAKSLDSINRYYEKAAELNGALNAANSFHAKTVGDYANKKITVAQENLARLETNLKALEKLNGADSEKVNNWINAWIDEGTLNSEELKDLRLKYEEISAEYDIVEPAVANTINWLNTHKNDTINKEDINDYLLKLNSAHAAYINAFTAVKNTINYYLGDEAIKDPDTGCVQLSDAYPLSVFSDYVGARENVVTINNEASAFVTTQHRFGSKLTWLGDDGIYTGDLRADQITGWCLRGLTFQSAENSEASIPNGVPYYIFNPNADSESAAFTKVTSGGIGPRWQLYKDGTGYVADGQISWDGDSVKFGNKVTIEWTNVNGGKDALTAESKELSDKIAAEKQALETALNNTETTLTNALNTTNLTVDNNYKVLTQSILDYKIEVGGKLNELNTSVKALEIAQDGSATEVTDFVNKVTSDKFISSDELTDINTRYETIKSNYKTISDSIGELITNYTEWKKSIDNHDSLAGTNDDLKISEIINSLNTNKDAIDTAYYEVVRVCDYYLDADDTDDGTEDGFIEVQLGYDLSVLADYEAIENAVAHICTQYITYYTTYNRWGSKTTWIGKEGLYSGTIMGDNIKGGCIQGLSIQSSTNTDLPDDLKWQKYNTVGMTGSFTPMTGGNGPAWQIYNNGSGHLAKGNINWTESGDLTVKGNILGSIGNSTNTNGDIDVNGSLNIKNNNKLASSLTPSNNNTKYDTITDESDASITRYVTLSTGIPDISKTYVWQSDGTNVNAPYSTLYTTRNYADTKNGTDIFDVFEYKNGSYVHIEDPCTVSSREVSTDGTYGSTSNTTISLIKNGVSYKYNSGTTKNIETDKERRSLGNTVILSDGTILTNAIIAKSGQYYGDINSDGVFKGKLDSASGYIKNCNISGSDITINGNKCFRVYKPNSVSTVSGDEETNVTNEILNISPNVTLTTGSETNYYISTASEYNQHRKNGNITWYKTTKLATINANKGDKIKIPAISITANIYQPRKSQGKNSSPTARVYISYANGDQVDILSKKSLSRGAESYNGRQYKWSVNSSATSLTAPCTGTAYVYIDISTWMNDKQVGDYAAASFHFDVNDNIVVGSNIQQNNKIFIGNNGLQIYTNTGNIIQTINGDIELLSSNGKNGLRITNDGILIQRNGSAWTNL